MTAPTKIRKFDKNHVTILDTTLRDGEQTPSCFMNLEEKLRVAESFSAVRLEEDRKTVNRLGADADTLVASARVYVNALNKLLLKRERTASAGAADMMAKGAVPV